MVRVEVLGSVNSNHNPQTYLQMLRASLSERLDAGDFISEVFFKQDLTRLPSKELLRWQ